MDLLACLNSFVRTVDTGSFSAVAREMAASQSAVTRQIGLLEEHFGVRLFHRSTRRLTLTDDGARLLDHARRLLEDAAGIHDILGKQSTSPAGVVRFGVSSAAARFLAPRLPALFERYPDLEVELDVSDQRHDLVESRIDVAMRAGDIVDQSVIARLLGRENLVLVASPDYLDRHGTPEGPDDLSRHSCIRYLTEKGQLTWRLDGPEGEVRIEVNGQLRANNIGVVGLLARSGLGIALLPVFTVIDHIREGRLRRVLPSHAMTGLPIHLIYPSRRNLPPRTRVFMDFVAEQFADALGAAQAI